MILLLLFPLLILAAQPKRPPLLGQPVNVKPYHESSSSSSCSNCSDNEESLFEPEQILIRKDDGTMPYYQFYTPGPGQFSPQSFQFYAPNSYSLTIVDCFCIGDAYQLYDNGELVSGGSCIPSVPNGACSAFVTDPWECLNSELAFCRQTVNFSFGWHNITILSIVAPYVTGGGFIFPNLFVDK